MSAFITHFAKLQFGRKVYLPSRVAWHFNKPKVGSIYSTLQAPLSVGNYSMTQSRN